MANGMDWTVIPLRQVVSGRNGAVQNVVLPERSPGRIGHRSNPCRRGKIPVVPALRATAAYPSEGSHKIVLPHISASSQVTSSGHSSTATVPSGQLG